MFASILTGKYCSQHNLLWLESLQEWLPFSEKRLLHTFGDSMCVRESVCPRCMAPAQAALQTQYPHLYQSTVPVQMPQLQ
jgi:hypothetical protein